MTSGLLIVNKPVGYSSHDIINKIRRVYKIKKCGHAGTLDPMAQGVLLVFMGKALKLIDLIPRESLDKRYLMRISLGRETDTYDATGTTVNTSNRGLHIPIEEIKGAIKGFEGISKQVPPQYSAIKVGGKKSYELARAGQGVELASREINISFIELISSYDANDMRHLVVRADCSRGTYVRALAHDLGQQLECGGHLSYLLREKVGAYHFKNAFPYWKLEHGQGFTHSKSFIKFEDILKLPKFTVSDIGEQHISHGRKVMPSDLIDLELPANANFDKVLMLNKAGTLLALYGSNNAATPSNLLLTPIKVFNSHDD